IDAVTEFKRNINSDNARRKVDGRTEARLIELACGPVPEGHSRWTIRLLEEESKVILETPVGREAIRKALKKTNFDLTKTTTGAFQQKKTQNSYPAWRISLMCMLSPKMTSIQLCVWMRSRTSFWEKTGSLYQ